MEETFITKYRPTTLDEVIGHKDIIKSLKELFKDKSKVPHGFIFSSDIPGIAKTSLSRIIGLELGSVLDDIIEIDGGMYSKVENARDLLSSLCYVGFTKIPVKFIIIDEAHSVSSAFWNAMLKTLEEPPSHVYFSFCTTNISKIPESIKTRCHCYNLKPINAKDIFDLLCLVVENEQLPLTNEQLFYIAQNSDGSPRKALSYLSQCRACKTIEEIANLIESPIENATVKDLCYNLVKGNWIKIQEILKNLKEQEILPETIRIQVCGYLNSCILNSKDKIESVRFLKLLNGFSKPFFDNTAWANLILACGGVFNG